MIDDVVAFLEGDTRAASSRLEARMLKAAERLQFERAAGYRRQLDAMEEISERQRVSGLSGDDRDMVGLARDQNEACGVILRVRDGRVMGKEHHVLGNVADASDGEALSLFLTRYYLRADRFPPQLLAPFDFDDRSLVETAIQQQAGHVVEIHVPQRGEKAKQVKLAARNARYQLEERRLREQNETERASEAVVELKDSLALARTPRRIACVDISTIQGEDSVGSVVTFLNGAPRKAGYRRFRVKYAEGQDDFAMMAEVVERYFRGLLDHDEPLPDLLLIDGGKGQLNAARAVLEEFGALPDLDIAGLAKREEEIYLPERKEPVWLPRRSRGLQTMQHIRNEAHRFAVSYHRKLHNRRLIRSELDDIPGIGPKRRATLLHHFQSVDRLRHSPADEIAKIPGFSIALAERVKAALE
jgi:excinuclease ABC subunit C